jgi:hypothetical protein
MPLLDPDFLTRLSRMVVATRRRASGVQLGERRSPRRPGESLPYRGAVPHEMVDLPGGPLEVLAVEGWLTSAGMNPGQPVPGKTVRGLP